MIFGIGTDIVEVSRIEASIAQFGEAFAKRVLADSEMAHYQESQIKARFLASARVYARQQRFKILQFLMMI